MSLPRNKCTTGLDRRCKSDRSSESMQNRGIERYSFSHLGKRLPIREVTVGRKFMNIAAR